MPPKFSLQNVLRLPPQQGGKAGSCIRQTAKSIADSQGPSGIHGNEKKHLMQELGSYQNGDLNLQKILQARTIP